jgi:hypothetical protein
VDNDGTLDERLWVVQDANYNVTMLFDNSGNVVERYIYDPFGQAMVLDANWNVLAASAFAWVYLHHLLFLRPAPSDRVLIYDRDF